MPEIKKAIIEFEDGSIEEYEVFTGVFENNEDYRILSKKCSLKRLSMAICLLNREFVQAADEAESEDN